MLGKNELDKLGIQDWSAIAAECEGSDLLLGNGFSLILAPSLHYNSLFEKFIANCNSRDEGIFRSFETPNFEFILEKLSNAKDVNKIFGIGSSEIKDAIGCLKEGLIKTIETVHPRWGKTDQQHLRRIAAKLDRFKDIFTLNYDLYLYRIILILNDEHRNGKKVQPYSDYFWEDYDDKFLRFSSSKEFEGYRHPYYLHGALFLFRGLVDDLKLRRANFPEELIEVIGDTIREGRLPLFVSEGTYEQKWRAIRRSHYLEFALEKLKKSDNNLVIFGTSLSDPDAHIVNAIAQNKRDLAVSIHIHTKSRDEVVSAKYRIRSMFPRHQISFFRADTLFDS
jgi:hypothetical protein